MREEKKGRKTQKQYEALFEELMEYTDFEDAESVTSVRDFAKQLSENAEKREVSNPKKFFNKKFLNAMGDALFRIRGKPQVKKRKVINKRRQVLESRRVFGSFKQAQNEGLTAVNPRAKTVYKVLIRRKGKTFTRYRDSKGRWARAPTIPEE